MAKYVLKDCKLWIAEFDMSGDHNSLTLEVTAAEHDVSVFGVGSRKRLAGLESAALQHQGFTDFADDAVDENLFARVAAASAPVSVAPTTGLENEPAITFNGIEFSYAAGGSVGDPHAFQASAMSDSPIVKGTILEDGTTTRTVTFNGTARQLGSVAAGKSMYAALHVLSISASATLDVVVQSDDASNFPSPASQITFTQATAKTSQWGTPAAGSITDTWWRVRATIGGPGPQIKFVVVAGIK